MASTASTNISSPELRSPVSLNSSSGEEVRLSADNPKRPTGRKKFTERRHPVYRGIRSKKSSDKWVCEIREPVRQGRIWLGTFPTAEMAARAYDVAAIALRGKSACVNFADSVSRMRIPDSTDPKVIQKAAAEGAKAFRSPGCEMLAPAGDEFNNEKAEECSSSSSFTYGAMNNETGESVSPFWSAFEDGFFDMEDMVYGYPGLLPNCFVSDEPEVYTDMSLWNY